MATRQDDQPAAGMPQVGRELAGELDRHDLVSVGMKEEHRHIERLHGGGLVVLGEQGVERRDVGLELEPTGIEAASHPGRTRRADRDDRGGLRDLGRGDREVPAHARAAQRDREVRLAGALAQERRHRRDVAEHPTIHRTGCGAVTALIDHDRGESGAEHDARVVVMALLARSGAVEDHDPTAHRTRFGQPQGVRNPVVGADLGRERFRRGAQSPHAAIMPAADPA